ncbi:MULTISPECIES: GntR family transcriptional regulator [Streptomyces violaceusniger group]|uniref:GntR family transcriptional regulator n=2 Tax=Streptomyces rhizosphaericus TaxID=114699 RepID=A0ABN1NTP4_9ACTN|nr:MULTISPECIES: GntR family transcriptional regulator [Streptomyces violaceusniger group]
MSVGELLQGRPGPRITDPRQTSVVLHAHLRELIIDGVLPPGTQLKQAELARLFAVSRTPLREAFRMLQEEGLVSAEPNQRSRVVGLDPADLELLYAARIALEALGVRLTAGNLTRTESRDASAALREMERTYRTGDLASWAVAHRDFHRLLVGRCGAVVLRTISSYAEQSERYIRLDQQHHRDDFHARQSEHVAILEAVREGDADRGGVLIARHLAGTALRVMEDVAPGRGAPAIDSALLLVGAGSDARASAQ